MPFPARGVPFPSDHHRGLAGKVDYRRHRDRQNEVVIQGGTSASQESLTIRSRKLARLRTVAERPLGADPVDPSALNSHERSYILDRPPSQLLNVLRPHAGRGPQLGLALIGSSFGDP